VNVAAGTGIVSTADITEESAGLHSESYSASVYLHNYMIPTFALYRNDINLAVETAIVPEMRTHFSALLLGKNREILKKQF